MQINKTNQSGKASEKFSEKERASDSIRPHADRLIGQFLGIYFHVLELIRLIYK
jgi:hypothetical protein